MEGSPGCPPGGGGRACPSTPLLQMFPPESRGLRNLCKGGSCPPPPPLPGLWSEAPPQAGSGGLSIPNCGLQGRLGGIERWCKARKGACAPSLSPGCPAAGLQKACWRVSVKEDTLDAFKRVSAGLSCSVPCPVSLQPTEGPSVTGTLRERTAALPATETRAPAPAQWPAL